MTDQNQSVFGKNPADQSQINNQESNGNSNQSVFETLVGPGRKFTDQEALAKAKAESDAFIEQLKKEKAELAEDLKNRMTAEEVAAKLREEISRPNAEGQGTTPKMPTEDELAKLIDRVANQRESQKTTANNLSTTESALIQRFGSMESATKAVEEKAMELGVSPYQLRDIAAQSPKAFYQMMGLDGSKPTPQAPAGDLQRNTFNSGAMPQGIQGDKLKEYYREMRKKNPTQYHSAAVQMEIFNLTKEGKL